MGRLIQCKKNENHWYSDHSITCPWCIHRQVTGIDPFPDDQASIHKTEPEKKADNHFISEPVSKNIKISLSFFNDRKFSMFSTLGIIFVLGIVVIIGAIILNSTFHHTEGNNIQLPTPQPSDIGDQDGKITIRTDGGKSDLKWGGEIRLSGENNISKTVYLFFIRAKSNRMFNLDDPPDYILVNKPNTFTTIALQPDIITWSYTWNLKGEMLKGVSCVVYAVANPTDIATIKSDPDNTSYARTDLLSITVKPD